MFIKDRHDLLKALFLMSKPQIPTSPVTINPPPKQLERHSTDRIPQTGQMKNHKKDTRHVACEKI
jgi:hypothetical protein